MKKMTLPILLLFLSLFCVGCGTKVSVDIAATTLPVYDLTTQLCEGTNLSVGRLVTESVSCLHDYTLQVDQMRMIESAEAVVISGAGLEAFMEEALVGSAAVIDASANAHIHTAEDGHDHAHNHAALEHTHAHDPHIWLSPENAKCMATNIAEGLTALYPEYAEIFNVNLSALLNELDALHAYGVQTLSQLSCRELITFHDGFAYFAESFDLTILRALEEESGSEASAAELKELILIIREHSLPSVFTERNGSVSAADIIAGETGAQVFELDMAMSGSGYFDAMYHNIDVIKEALG